MKRCVVCGMAENNNEAHSSLYRGVGKHTFKLVASSLKSITGQDIDDDIIVYSGDLLKSLTEDGKFEGYLVRFSSADDPDLIGDYFTKSTEFYVDDGAIIPILYDHGLNATIKRRKIGRAKVSYDDAGLFIKGELFLRDAFEKAINEKLIKAKKAGLSSGAASHMTERKSIKSGVSEILAWGIAEGSITVAPTEPRCEVTSLKSYMEERIDPLEIKADIQDSEDFDPVAASKEHGFQPSSNDPTECVVCGEEFAEGLHTKSMTKKNVIHKFAPSPVNGNICINCKKTEADGNHTAAKSIEEESFEAIQRPLKGLFEEKLAERTPSIWEIRNTLDDVCRDIASASLTSDITGVDIDIQGKVTEAVTECAAREIPLIVKQLRDWVDNGGDREGNRFYLRSIQPSSFNGIGEGLGTGLNLNEHSAKVVTALGEFVNLATSLDGAIKAYVERCEEKIEFRANDPLKAGRVISALTLQKLTSIKDLLTPIVESLGGSQNKLTELIAAGQKAGTAAESKSVDAGLLRELEFDLARHQTDIALMELQ